MVDCNIRTQGSDHARNALRGNALRGRGDNMKNLTPETRRLGEKSGDRVIARDRVIGNASSTAFSASSRLSGETRSRVSRLGARRHVRIALQLVLTTPREIFDDNAYERFLRKTQTSRSLESYRASRQQ